MDAQLLKLADLQIDQSYCVIDYRPISTKFGNTYILRCVESGWNNQPEFKMYATKLLSSYISTKSPNAGFYFTVKKNYKCTYAKISGYYPK